jgi:hypothetical protein
LVFGAAAAADYAREATSFLLVAVWYAFSSATRQRFRGRIMTQTWM